VRMGRTEMIIRLVVIAALLFFVYYSLFTGGGLNR
jgi:hypothetical protein